MLLYKYKDENKDKGEDDDKDKRSTSIRFTDPTKDATSAGERARQFQYIYGVSYARAFVTAIAPLQRSSELSSAEDGIFGIVLVEFKYGGVGRPLVTKFSVCLKTLPSNQKIPGYIDTRHKNDLAAYKTRLSEVNKSFKGMCVRLHNKIPAEIQNLPFAEVSEHVFRIMRTVTSIKVSEVLKLSTNAITATSLDARHAVSGTSMVTEAPAAIVTDNQ
ncbi:hypothetical protein EVAR_21703_1 [Eumeta japonica]|uniref:Uncharacterized protein n=1 Tax=Eumeta variegata TaxID=151549 RepID=A0A4C1W5E5_EUMVA|nr:hypothetical protein EVAR_21703_1 [Eumeta japonica]